MPLASAAAMAVMVLNSAMIPVSLVCSRYARATKVIELRPTRLLPVLSVSVT